MTKNIDAQASSHADENHTTPMNIICQILANNQSAPDNIMHVGYGPKLAYFIATQGDYNEATVFHFADDDKMI